MLRGFFPIFALFNHTTFSQTQTGATAPLVEKYTGVFKNSLKIYRFILF
jgi:hypothetical protein